MASTRLGNEETVNLQHIETGQAKYINCIQKDAKGTTPKYIKSKTEKEEIYKRVQLGEPLPPPPQKKWRSPIKSTNKKK